MNPLYNPFSPGAGTPPPELAGRNHILEQALITLGRIKRGRAEKSIFLIGLRGTGKTVLLKKISDLAKEEGYHVAKIEAQEKKSLPELLLPELRQLLFKLNAEGTVNAKVKKALRVFKSFISSFKITTNINGVDLTLGVEAEVGTADSGDLEADLSQLFVALGEAAQEKETAIAIIIDELQYLNDQELSALIMAAHRMSQESLPVAVIAAGLPQLVGKAGKAKSYAERLFDYPEIGPLTIDAAKLALQEPVQKEGVAFTAEALDEIFKKTKGYPYFLQEWGSQAWKIAESSPIDLNVIHKATQAAIQQLDQSFFRVRFDRLTNREKEYLRALAELGEEQQRSGNVAQKLKLAVQEAAPLRNNLIKKGMIYSPKHGDTAFTVPLFGEFMKRIMPNFELTQKEIK